MGLFSKFLASWEKWKEEAVLAAQVEELARMKRAKQQLDANTAAGSDPSMNEGDFHSGPGGYSPNTAYQETQYGSGFDQEAEWNEEH